MKTSSKIALGVGAGVGIGATLFGISLIIVGILLSLTLIGAIIGIPLILFGFYIMAGGMGVSVLTGASVVVDEAINEYYKEKGHICAHCGGPLKEKQTYYCQQRHYLFGKGFDVVPVCKSCAEKCKDCGKWFCLKHIENHKCKKIK